MSVLHAIFVDSTHVSASVQSPLDLCHTVEGRNTCSNPQHPQPKFESCDCKFLQDFQQQTEDSNITNTTPKNNTLSTYYYNTIRIKSNHNSIRSSNALSSFTSPLKTHLSKLPSWLCACVCVCVCVRMHVWVPVCMHEHVCVFCWYSCWFGSHCASFCVHFSFVFVVCISWLLLSYNGLCAPVRALPQPRIHCYSHYNHSKEHTIILIIVTSHYKYTQFQTVISCSPWRSLKEANSSKVFYTTQQYFQWHDTLKQTTAMVEWHRDLGTSPSAFWWHGQVVVELMLNVLRCHLTY